MTAISLYAKPSADFDAKVEESVALLRRAAAEFSPITQASSLGVEDMVVTDLLQRFGVPSARLSCCAGACTSRATSAPPATC